MNKRYTYGNTDILFPQTIMLINQLNIRLENNFS